jgi:hypothetical protein
MDRTFIPIKFRFGVSVSVYTITTDGISSDDGPSRPGPNTEVTATK